MNYHDIRTDDMLNGDGLRVVLFTSACSHHCKNCHNPETWDCDSGIKFDSTVKDEILNEMGKDYISGITLSGGDPLNSNNLKDVYDLCSSIKSTHPNKTIWLYTGYKYDFIMNNNSDMNNEFRKLLVISFVDVLVDGKYVDELKDVNYHWAGSTNQLVIDVKKSLETNEIVLWE